MKYVTEGRLDTAHIRDVSGIRIFRIYQSSIILNLTDDSASKPENTGWLLTSTVGD